MDGNVGRIIFSWLSLRVVLSFFNRMPKWVRILAMSIPTQESYLESRRRLPFSDGNCCASHPDGKFTATGCQGPVYRSLESIEAIFGCLVYPHRIYCRIKGAPWPSATLSLQVTSSHQVSRTSDINPHFYSQNDPNRPQS